MDWNVKELVTCIISCCNQIDSVFGTIDSVLKQDYNSIELIFTDDCSRCFDKSVIDDYVNSKKKTTL